MGNASQMGAGRDLTGRLPKAFAIERITQTHRIRQGRAGRNEAFVVTSICCARFSSISLNNNVPGAHPSQTNLLISYTKKAWHAMQQFSIPEFKPR